MMTVVHKLTTAEFYPAEKPEKFIGLFSNENLAVEYVRCQYGLTKIEYSRDIDDLGVLRGYYWLGTASETVARFHFTISEVRVDALVPKLCACGNALVLAGYRVCGDCKAAREQYPHVFADEATDESESER